MAPEVVRQTFDMRKNMLLFKSWPSQKISKKSTIKSCTVCAGTEGGKGEGGVFFWQALTFFNAGGSILDPDSTRSVDPDPGSPRKMIIKKRKKSRSFMN